MFHWELSPLVVATDFKMAPQIHFSLECSSTLWAGERLVSRVFPAVRYQVGRLAECFSTYRALVRFLAWKKINQIRKRPLSKDVLTHINSPCVTSYIGYGQCVKCDSRRQYKQLLIISAVLHTDWKLKTVYLTDCLKVIQKDLKGSQSTNY